MSALRSLPEKENVISRKLRSLYYLCFCSVKRRLRSNALARSFGPEENLPLINLAYGRTLKSLPDSELKVKVMVSPQPVQQPDAGYGNLHIDPEGHCQALDNVNERSDNRPYARLRYALKIHHKATFARIFFSLWHFLLFYEGTLLFIFF